MKKGIKRILSAFLAAVMVVCAAPLSGFVGLDFDLGWLDFSMKSSAFDSSGSCGENVTYTFDEDSDLLTISGTGDMQNYSISDSSPFKDFRYYIKTIVINNGVTSIGDYVFYYCYNLTSITIPDSVTSIGDSSFSECEKLTSIIIPDSVTDIGTSAFILCRRLKSVIIPNSVISIGDSAFVFCSSLTSINIPDGVTSIGDDTFGYCENLTNINIPDSVTRIGEYAFNRCSKIANVTIPYGVTSIGYSAFAHCEDLESIIVDEKNTVFDSRENCNAIIKSNTNELIYGCKSSFIPDSVTKIGISAFDGCVGLKSINIPESVTSIGDYAFNYCSLLDRITVDDNNTVYDSRENCNAIIESDSNKLIYGCNSTVIPDSVISIKFRAFSGLTTLENIEIPESVTSIGSSAFSGCSSLKEITVPSSVDKIDDNTFKNCTALKTVNLPDGITEIGEKAFYNTAVYNDPASYKGNKALYLGDNRYLIAYGNQLYGQRFNGIVNPDTVLIADGAFRGADCETVQLNEGLKYIGREAFADSSVKTVYFPESLEDCSNDIFNGCGSLTVNYGSSISDWYGMDIFLPENSVVYFTAKTEDGKVSVIYCSDDLPQEIGDISIDENSPGVTARILEKESSMTENEFKMSDHTFSVDLYENFEPIDITLKNKKGEIQPKAGRSVRVKIKAPDSVREKILEILDFKGDFDELKINKDGFYLNGNLQYFSEKRQDEVKNKIFIIHFYNKGEYMGKKNETITFKDRLELENGYLIFSVSHFSEFSFFTGCFEFVEKEINLDIGKEKKLDYIQIDDQKTLSFASSKPSVATVDSSGVVTAQKSGETVITAYCDGVEVGNCKVTVNEIQINFGTNIPDSRLDYLTTANFSCKVENLPEGATVCWYIDSFEYAKGESCTVKNIKENFAICIKVLDKDGNVIKKTDSLTVKVKTGFFDKLLGFFRKLFGTLKKVDIS